MENMRGLGTSLPELKKKNKNSKKEAADETGENDPAPSTAGKSGAPSSGLSFTSSMI